MRARYASSLFLCLFFCIPFYSNAGSYFFSVFAGASKVEMKEYNDSINEANAYNSELGINSSLKKLDLAVLPDITIGYDFIPEAGAYIRNCGILLVDSDSKASWSDGVQAQTIKGDFSAVFTGVGLRYNISDKNTPDFSGYVSMDGGVCHYYANYMEESAYKEDGGVLYSIRKDWDTAVPAGSVEAGMNWWVNGAAGIGIKAGYRLAAGKVMLRITNISGWTGESQGMSTVDYSGVYANAGAVFKFDNWEKKKPKAPASDGQFPEISAKLYSEALEYYEDGLLRKASEKIEQAAGTAQGDEKIAALKAKIDTALKSEKSGLNIEKLLKQADELRAKKQFKKSRARYMEVLAMEENNSQAGFYIKEFDTKATELFILAKSLMAAGDNEKSYRNAKLASEYNPENEEISELVNKLKGVVNDEKDVTRKYNKGVEEFKHGRYEEAVELWEEVLIAKPDDIEAAENKEKAMKKIEENGEQTKAAVEKAAKQAQNLYDIGKLQEAARKCAFVLRLNPENEKCKNIRDELKKLDDENKAEVITKR